MVQNTVLIIQRAVSWLIVFCLISIFLWNVINKRFPVHFIKQLKFKLNETSFRSLSESTYLDTKANNIVIPGEEVTAKFLNDTAAKFLSDTAAKVEAAVLAELATIAKIAASATLTTKATSIVSAEVAKKIATTEATITAEVNTTGTTKYLTKVAIQDDTYYLSLYSMGGRIGNQMFQYASAYGIAKHNNRVLVTDSYFEISAYFSLNMEYFANSAV